MLDLRLQHRRHPVRHRPHALADLRPPREAALQADVDVLVLVGDDPVLALDEVLAAERARLHRGMDLVAGAVEEAGVDEDHPVLRRPDAFLQVDAGAPLLVHDPELHRVPRQPERCLDMGEDVVGEGHLVGAVHLRLDHVDRPGDRVARAAGLSQVVQRDQRRHHRVHQPLEYLAAIAVEDRRVGHQMPDVAHQHQRAALHRDLAPVRRGEGRVRVQAAGQLLATLLERLGKVALHQPEPVAIGRHLVLGVDAGDRILAVHDRGHRAFQADVGQPGPVATADLVGAVEDQLHMQPVVAQQHRLRRARMAAVADELLRLRQRQVVDQQRAAAHVVAPRVGMTGAVQRKRLVEEHPRPRHDPRAPTPVIAAGRRRAAHRVGAVQAVVEAAPAGVRRIQREPGIGDRHHELRPGNAGDFAVHVLGRDAERLAFRQQVADLGEEGLVGHAIVRLVAPLEVPGVDLRLQLGAPSQQRRVVRPELVDQRRKSRPEGVRLDARPGKRLLLDEQCQHRRDPKVPAFREFGQGASCSQFVHSALSSRMASDRKTGRRPLRNPSAGRSLVRGRGNYETKCGAARGSRRRPSPATP